MDTVTELARKGDKTAQNIINQTYVKVAEYQLANNNGGLS